MANVIASVGPATPAPTPPVVGVGALPGAPPAAVAAVAPVTPVSTAGSGGNRSPAGGESLRTVVGQGDAPISLAPAVGRYLFEPNPAVLAAGLAGSLAAEHH